MQPTPPGRRPEDAQDLLRLHQRRLTFSHPDPEQSAPPVPPGSLRSTPDKHHLTERTT